jgi:hypothetical protein
MTAIPLRQRVSHAASVARLLHRSDEMVALANGYAFRFAPDDLNPVADFVNRERLCCPFLGFTIEVSPAGGPMWVSITGREGVKEFLAAELSIRAPSETGEQGGEALVTNVRRLPSRHVIQAALVVSVVALILGLVGLCLAEALGVVEALSLASFVGLAACLVPCLLTAIFLRRKWRERRGGSFRC